MALVMDCTLIVNIEEATCVAWVSVSVTHYTPAAKDLTM
jgi:hypothetical protein